MSHKENMEEEENVHEKEASMKNMNFNAERARVSSTSFNFVPSPKHTTKDLETARKEHQEDVDAQKSKVKEQKEAIRVQTANIQKEKERVAAETIQRCFRGNRSREECKFDPSETAWSTLRLPTAKSLPPLEREGDTKVGTPRGKRSSTRTI